MTLVVGARIETDSGDTDRELDKTAAKVANVGKAAEGATRGTSQLKSETDALAGAQGRAAQSSKKQEAAVEQVTGAMARNTKQAGAQRAGYQQLGFQVQDTFQQFALGVNPLVILAQQGGQTASAIALMGAGAEGTQNKFIRFATFLSGPWGAALFGAATIVGFLVQNLLQAETAAEAAEKGADGLADAQSTLGEIFDLTSGKIKAQNELLVLNARLLAINLRSEALAQRASAKDAFVDAGAKTVGGFFSQNPYFRTLTGAGKDTLDSRLQDAQTLAARAQSAKILADPSARKAILEDVLAKSEKLDFSGLSTTRTEFQQALIDDISADFKEQTARKIDESLDKGELANSFRRTKKPPNPKKPPKPKSNTAEENRLKALAEFGESAAEKIQRINERFGEQPRLVNQVAQATRELDDLIADLEKRKPPNFEKSIASANAARIAAQEALERPYNDLRAANDRFLEQQSLVLQGREREAEALARIAQFEERNGDLKAEQRAEIYAQVIAEEEINRLIEERGRKLSIYGAAVDDTRAALEDLLSGGKAGDFLSNIQSTFKNLQGRLLTESIFGPVERELDDFLNGRTGLNAQIEQLEQDHKTVGDASQRLADTFDDAVTKVRNAADRIANPDIVGIGPQGNQASGVDPDTGVIVVQARPDSASYRDPSAREFYDRLIDKMVGGIAGELDATFGTSFFSQMQGVFSGALSGYAQAGTVGGILGGAQGLAQLFGDNGIIGKGLAETVSKTLGQAGEGAVAGYRNAAILDAVGIKSSKSGGAIGGAIGNFIPGLPPGVGSLVGSLAGSLIGGAIKGTKRGSATITSIDGAATSRGNSSEREKASLGLAGSVQDALRSLAEEFDAEIGNFAVSIGQRKDNFRVDTSGRGVTKTSKGARDFGDDEAGAIAFAVLDAISDGGLKGLSAAVQQALGSSTDLQKAVKEALKVREIEDILGGIGGAIEKEVRGFEKQAGDRVRIARQYGFDVLKIEEHNAQERAKLVEDILSDRVGALKALLEDLAFGDLAEGTPAEKRQRLLGEIADTETKAEAGTEGAADRLADLNRRLIALSRDAYGTAGGEFSADRAQAISSAERIIEIENERIRAAQDAVLQTNNHLEAGNRLASETNDILAQIKTGLAGLTFGSSGGADDGGFGLTGREVRL